MTSDSTTTETTIPLQDRVKRIEERRLSSINILIGLSAAIWLLPLVLTFIPGAPGMLLISLFSIAGTVSVISTLLLLDFRRQRVTKEHREREKQQLQYIADEVVASRLATRLEVVAINSQLTAVLAKLEQERWMTYADGVQDGIAAAEVAEEQRTVVPMRPIPQPTNGHHPRS